MRSEKAQTFWQQAVVSFGTILFVWGTLVLGLATAWAADQPTPDTEIGDLVTDPLTGEDATVTDLVEDEDTGTVIAVITDAGRLIYTTTAVGDVFPAEDEDGDWTITVADPDGDTGFIDEITMERTIVTDPGPPEVTEVETQTLIVAETYAASDPVDEDGNPISPDGTPGDPETTIDPPPPAEGDSNYIYVKRIGADGDDGRDGYGVRFCILKRCWTVAYEPKPGEDGSTGPTIKINVPSDVSSDNIPSATYPFPKYSLITTATDGRSGIKAISIGGDGGEGGDAYGNIDAENGGDAGDGGNITVNTDTEIRTSGERAPGVYASSLAGVAGDGGTGYIGSYGGDSGDSAKGGTVRVTNGVNGLISTTGNGSHGIFALSSGGAAGDGGDSWGIVGEAGSALKAGNGGSVYVTNRGDIVTDGEGSHGVLAQSIGGTGGDGGDAGGIVALGGDGSEGGNGGFVKVTTDAGSRIETLQIASHGILAESIGGGGGNGGVGGGIVGIGAEGDGGGNGGGVSIVHNGSIETYANGSFGILAQSIGGGGGNAGVGAGVVGIGAEGAGGGDGGNVTLTAGDAASVTTWGDISHGILMQSIGGGGGFGSTGAGVVGIGGTGSGGGDGGTVTINSGTEITTNGDYSKGLYTQSIGGGGGDGGVGAGVVGIGADGKGGGDGGAVSVTNRGAIDTWGFWSDAIFVQSIGGGGGSGASAGGAVSLGGDGGSSGDGDQVTVTNSGALTTRGVSADAIFAQSVGGGGGSGGGSGGIVSIGGDGESGGDGGRVEVVNNGTIITVGDGADGLFAQSIGGGGGSGAPSGGAVSLGGQGESGGDGGDVEIKNYAAITTVGRSGTAIFAQSIGGGGGDGGASGGAVSLGGDGSGGGSAGQVDVQNSGDLSTSGDYSEGIFAQSVGGGGGRAAGSGGLVSLGGNSDEGGTAGDVEVVNLGSIHTRGDSSEGIFAQSVGGGGGDGAGSGGVVSIGGSGGGSGGAGSVTVTQGNGDTSGSIVTEGDYSEAIFAQSVGGGGGNGAASGGVVSIGGSGSGAADGNTVEVTNYDTLLTFGTESSGIFAQSVGGGGGNGAASGGLVAIGGSGSVASDGGAVTVTNAGQITTTGYASEAIFAQSVGGGGGSGGTTGGVLFTIGGQAGGGGDAGTVTVTSSNDLVTRGDDADAIFAQSLGGGGGNAGSAASGSLMAGVAIGGKGGDGGDGESVAVTVETHSVNGENLVSLISTEGDRSRGIFAQSVGGGGGNGGFAVQGSVGTFGAVSVAVGGSAGNGGDGENATLNAAALVSTLGEDADGVVVQSIGGGGGNGGFSVSGAMQVNPKAGGAISVGVGGSGGDGGDAGTVVANLSGGISTEGDMAEGLLAQSLGGGGGNGGFNVNTAVSVGGVASGSVAVGVGGSAGGGGDGSTVSSQVNGDISTAGDDAGAMIAQSVGGGGGNGGFNVTAAVSAAVTASAGVSVGVGGSGGDGGIGDAVTVDVLGNLTTLGNRSDALLAQSVGGGGGNGGFNVSFAGSGAKVASGAVSVGVGGSGGGGGDAGAVDGIFNGNIVTVGNDSDGAVFQSIGGGGGNGAFNVSGVLTGAGTASLGVAVGVGGSGGGGGQGAAVDAEVNGTVATGGNQSEGIIVQSVGGGGGNGGFNVSGVLSFAGTGSVGGAIGVGGAGGDGGDGGLVTAQVDSRVTTEGHNAGAVVVQSVGGGGGNGGVNVSGTISGAGTGSGGIAVGVGGSGGGGGDGSAVNANIDGVKSTIGDNSSAVLVQSVGGGGGNGGVNVSAAVSISRSAGGALAVGVGGFGGDGGNGDVVTASVDGLIETSGEESTGVLAQSVGGGGGNGAVNVSGTLNATGSGIGASIGLGLGGFGGGGGTAGDVSLSRDGDTITRQDDSVGVAAQSLAGGGGNGGINVSSAVNFTLKQGGAAVGVGVGGFGGDGGSSGNVSADITGSVQTGNNETSAGENATGVLVQSIAGGGGNGGTNISSSLGVELNGTGAAVSLGLGGFGGGGGDAGIAELTMTGDVVTNGANADGVLVQSVGGGGGNGALNVSAGVNVSGNTTSFSSAIGVGGFGGDGGDAADVSANVTGSVVASGLGRDDEVVIPDMVFDGDPLPGTGTSYRIMEDGSNGIVAQSLGGGGGNGGINISGGMSLANPTTGKTGSLVLGVGGFGGGGGNAGQVDVTVDGEWVTAIGDERSAILAQSLGGGGGNGGINISGGIVMDGPLIAGVGGFGGDGGTAGDVNVDAQANVRTEGRDAVGLLAQSIGGGGGNGGINISGSLAVNKKGVLPAVTFGLGGFGGEGAVSGDVDVTHTGSIATAGDSSHGLMAQSLAGGGGNGALNVAGSINHTSSQVTSKATDLSMVVGIGGHGGAGADAGSVDVVSSGDIVTDGDYARGLFAQSIGGGGGNGGMNVSTVLANQGSPIIVGVGGFGSGGGHAGDVTVDRGNADAFAGTIQTSGKAAVGLEATSIGGGGGDAGMNFLVSIATGGSSTGNTTSENPWKGKVDDSVIANYDKVIQELSGNSGGSSGTGNIYSLQLAIGGAGGEAGNGGEVTVNNYSDIVTDGFQSYGLLAQSIGGGGGNANLNLGLGYAPNARSAKIALGGATGDGGTGGKVTVSHQGDIATDGDDSIGILAQSIGGGGGNAGFDFVFNKTKAGALALGLGREGGTGGSGGNVSLTADGNIRTTGDNAYGLLAQSLGNGGGNSSAYSGGLSSPDSGNGEVSGAVSVGIVGGVGGEGGNVALTASGTVTTLGDKAHAIFAQSVGGGGGNGGNANTAAITAPSVGVSVGGEGGEGGVGGTVNVSNRADLYTLSENAIGILAQSVGGGGGTGGAAFSGGLKTSGSGLQVTVGGVGGTGADGGTVDVGNSGIIFTEGERSHGIVAQSLGGGGGDGGMVINGLINTSSDPNVRAFVSVGGNGGVGGVGSAAMVDNTGAIVTSGKEAVGILAQSIGGGGGSGGLLVNGSISYGGGGGTIGVNVGGVGGTGGTGGDVTVRNQVDEDAELSGEIYTSGDGAHGVMALSIGGGGGTGSTVVTSFNTVNASSPSTALALSIGGDGGVGGSAGEVMVWNDGRIVTLGTEAHGIVAESIGGGGGNGGLSIAGNLLLSSPDTAGLNSAISVGGNGGDGNVGNDVVVNNSGSIETYGDKSYGIFAQSVGGGGGNGGTAIAASIDPTLVTGLLSQSSLLSIGVGGAGGDGAMGGDVTVNHSGTIVTNGDDTYGVYAQSVGGGGGTSALSFSSPFWMAADFVLPALLGSKDSSAGVGGDVDVNTADNIITNGANSSASFSQAISSGGGDLNLYLDISQDASSLDQEVVDVDEVTSVTEEITAFFKGVIGLGGEGNQDNDGGTVTNTHVGDILTTGDNSAGLEVQSVGGGGGTSHVDVLARSEDVVELDLTLGAIDSTNVGGGAIAVARDGQVVTLGTQSKGVSIQSIGGGGGRLDLTVTRTDEDTQIAAGTTTVQMGAVGGIDHDSGSITLDMSGDLYTAGDRSQGIFAQSIGAGGGELRLTGTGSAEVLLGGQEGATGNGGDISLLNEGLVMTEGVQAHGIFLQSIGGGGGALFSDLDPSTVSLTLSAGGIGDGGRIDLQQTGDILTSGDRAYGVFLQSIGGGGGTIDSLFAGSSGGLGSGGEISVTLSGDVVSAGADATAVFLQSVGGPGAENGAISLILKGALVAGGTGDAVGVHFDGGADNSLLNYASLLTLEGVDGMALLGGTGSEQVDNYGTVIGNFDLGGGANAFYNHEDSWLFPGATAILGSGNLLTNAGFLSPGDLDRVQTTSLVGDFLQSETGFYLADLDFDGNVADRLSASGEAVVDGQVDLNTLHPENLLPGRHDVVIISGEAGLVDTGTELSVAPSAVVGYQLTMPDTNSLAVGLNIDFSPEGLTDNLERIGDYFNRIQLAGGSAEMGPVIADLFGQPDLPSLATTYDYMNPDYYDHFTQTELDVTRQLNRMVLRRMQAVRRDEQTSPSLSGTRRAVGRDERVHLAFAGSDQQVAGLFDRSSTKRGYGVWLNISRLNSDQQGTEEFDGFDAESRVLAAGVDRRFGDQGLAGLSFGYSRATLDLDDHVSDGRIEGFHLSLYGGYDTEDLYVDGILSYGRQDYDNDRLTRVLGDYRLATSDHDGNTLSLFGEVGRHLTLENWLVQPYLSLNYIYLDEGSFSEEGAEMLSLNVKRRSTQSLFCDAGIRFTGLFETVAGVVSPGISLGLSHDFGLDDRTVRAGFAGYPGASFSVEGREPERVSFLGGLSLSVRGEGGVSAALKYQHEVRHDFKAREILAEIRVAF